MKKNILSIAAFLFGMLTAFADNISVPDVTVAAGETATVGISLNNTETNIVSFQMDLTLPEGITVNKAGCSLTSRITDEEQELTIGKQGDNVYRLTSTSFALTPISGTSGEIITLSLTAAADSEGGTATISNIRLATSSSVKLTLDDVVFNVNFFATGITVSPTSLNLYKIEDTATLTATVAPAGADKSVTWTSSDTSVATVDENGTVTAVAYGTATITATTNDGTDLTASCEVTVSPYDFESNNIFYRIVDADAKTVEVTCVEEGEGNADFYFGNISIPKRISKNGTIYTVIGIGEHAFHYCNNLTSITIGDNVTSNGGWAFMGCTSLTTVSLPSGLLHIGYSAFDDCYALANITIPSTATDIEGAAFSDCHSLTSITLPEGLTSIGDWFFDNCTGLTEITIPSTVTEIGHGAFSGCTNLGNITFPEGLTRIGEEAFLHCDAFTSIVIPGNVTSIGRSAFAQCPNISSIVVEEGNSTYDSRDNCNAIIETETNKLISGCKTTVIPENVTVIGEFAFYYCTNLTTITIPENVTIIEASAFRSCTSLEKIIIPADVTAIGSYAFEETFSLTSVTVNVESPLSIDNTVFSNRANATLYVPAGCKDAYEDADYWTEFSEIVEMPGVGYEFTTAVPCNDGTANLTFKVTSTRPWEVEVSASPEDIAGALTIPATVTNENGIEFAVKSIGKHAFDGWERGNAHSITSVMIAEGITTIDTWAFQNCPELETVILPESVENIYGAAFAYSPKLSAINIPTRLKTIYDWLFVNCTALKSIDLPEGITEIKNHAFRGSGLESIKFPSTLTSVGQAAFQACENLTQIDFGGCTATIEGDAFSWCNSLEEVYIPNTITLTGYFTFAVCESLREVIFEEGNPSEGICQTFIGAFIQSSLETVVLPSTAIMGDQMFRDCTKLKSVTFLSGAPSDNSNHYAKNFINVPDDVLFTIPEGTAESYLRAGFKNLSDLSGLPLVREEFEAEATRISQMADALTDGDKATLTTAISEARAAVNAADDYPTVYAQIAAIKSAAKTYLLTATLPENTDVTAAAITNPDFDRFDIGWSLEYIGHKLGYQDKEDNNHFENGDVVMDNFIEAWHGSLSYLSDGKLSQTITRLTAGIYRLEADIIAACEYDASVEVTGVSLFAGNQSTPVATENEKPQHFSVKFENPRTMDVTIGINVSGTNANWIAADNFRLYYEGKAADIPQGADLVSDENARLYLYNVETGKYLSTGHAFGTHAILDETGLPIRISQNEETGLWTIYFWDGNSDQKRLFQEENSMDHQNTDTWANDDGNHGYYWWNITQAADGSLLIQNEAAAVDEYLGNDPTKQDFRDEGYNGISYTDVNAYVSADKNIHWLLFSKDDCDQLAAKHRLMDAILRMETSNKVNNDLLTTARDVYENADATLAEIIDITTLLNSQMGMPKTDEPVDMTALIINPRFENNTTEGWSGANVVGGRSDATSNQEQEFFEKDFNMYQIITGVPNGRYMLKWKGFHRPGNKADVAAEYASGTDNASAVVYGNEVQKTMKHIASEMRDTRISDGDFEYDGKYFPDDMESVRKYFNEGFYADELEVEVTDNVLTIGVKNTQPMGGAHWVIFSDFELYIMENEEQLYHKLTADDINCVPGCMTTFNVNLLNRDNVTGFQFEVELPEGVTIYEENGQRETQLTNRGNGHMFQCIPVGNNTYQFSALSLQSKSFKKNEGPVVRMTLTTDGTMELGDYPIKVKNTELSKPNGMQVLPFDFTSTLTVKAADPGDVNGDGKITVTDAVYVFKKVNGETPEYFQPGAADVNHDNKITINDAVQIVNMVLGNGQAMGSRAAKRLLKQLAGEY